MLLTFPVEGTVANTDTITLPEIFHDFETAVADLKYVVSSMLFSRLQAQ